MKRKHVQLIIGVSVVALNLFSSNLIVAAPKLDASFASKVQTVDAYKLALADVPAAELPARVAELIANAPEADRQTIAAAVVKAAVSLHPSSAGPIISAIARNSPDVVVVAVRSALSVNPGAAKSVQRALTSARSAQVRAYTSTSRTTRQRAAFRAATINMRAALIVAREVLIASVTARRDISNY